MTDTPWRDAETLEHLYHEKRLSTYEIADELDCSQPTVARWMRKHEIKRRTDGEQVQNYELRNPDVYIGSHPRGYEQVEHRWGGERYRFLLHRLVAVAEYGFDAVCDALVHHKNGLEWDNRPDNLQLVPDDARHSQLHAYGKMLDKLRWRDAELMERLYTEDKLTASEIANKLGCEQTTILRWLRIHDIPVRDPR